MIPGIHSKGIDLSFVILTWNSVKHIAGCLSSIETALGGGSLAFEVLIVDNGSRDGTRALIKAAGERSPHIIKPIFLNKNMGTTHSRNLALRKAEGEFVVVMDSDVELIKGTVEGLVDFLRMDPSTGLAAPRLLYGNGMLQKSTDAFPTFWNKIRRYFFLKAMEKKEEKADAEEAPRSVDYAISAFWVLPRHVFLKVGMLDEEIFYAPEDVDYCLRLWKAGFKVVYVPAFSAFHHAQEISRGFRINAAFIRHLKGLLYYFRKHGYIFRKPRIPAPSKF